MLPASQWEMSYLLWTVWNVILIVQAQTQYPPPPVVDIRQPLQGLSYNVRITDNQYSSYAGEYFATHLNFDDIPGSVVIGSADRLSLLREDLSLVQTISLATTNESDVASCLANQSPSDASAACRNLIHVFSSAPSNPSRLVVCGSEAVGTPTCRSVSVFNGSLVSSVPTPTSPGILSTKPKYFEYGDIINGISASAATFFSVSSYPSANQYNVSYYTFTYSNTSDHTSLQVSQSFQLKSGSLTTPVTMVGVHKGNYPPRKLSPDQTTVDEHFVYFLFFREYSIGGTNTPVNRVGRLCQNDIGVTISPGVTVARSFMKTYISCTVPSLPSLYNYNYMQSSAPNGRGRFYVNGDWAELVYAAFSNFQGTEYNNSVICLYRADNTKIDSTDDLGFNGGVFDTFRSRFSNYAINTLIECQNQNRDINNVELETPIVQYTANPLAMFMGFVISTMVVDQTCVVVPDGSACVNQDVIFLGTSLGKVIKMSMVVGSSGVVTPVTSQEIMLNEIAPVRQLAIHSVGGVKYLYVNTDSNIYRLPVQRCGNYTNCRTCVASRDPYCVWNTTASRCMMSSLVPSTPESSATVPSNIYQNIHTGYTNSCPVWKSCSFTSLGAYYSSPLGVCIRCQFVRNVRVTISDDITRNVSITLLPSAYNAMEYSGCSSLDSSGLQVYTLSLFDDDGALQDTAYFRPPEGPPLPLSDTDYIIDQVQNTSFRITMAISKYGRKFDTYNYQVLYNSSTYPTQVTTPTSLLAQPSVTLSGFQAGDVVSYQIVVSNGYPAPPIYSALNTVTLRSGIPDSVTNLTVTSASDVGVVLSWAPPMSSVGAIIGYSVWMNGVQVTQCALSGQSPSYEASDLISAFSYSFAVSACTTSGEGPAVTVTTTTRCTPPPEVQSFVFVSTESGVMNYTWEPPVGNYDSLEYQVDSVCYNSLIPRTSILVTSEDPRLGSLTGLDPQLTCCVSIYAIANCSLTFGDPLPLTGAQATFCQLTRDVVPLAVRNLSSTLLSPTSALLHWDTPLNYLYAGYPSSISYNVTMATQKGSSIFTTTVPRLLLGSLDVSTLYTVSVTPFTSAGSGPRTTTTVTSSGLPSPLPPTNLTLKFTWDGEEEILTVLVTWLDSTSELYAVTSYVVHYRCNDVIYDETNVTASRATFYVQQAPYIWCSASVQGVNAFGRSLLSDLVEDYFPGAPPPMPGCYETVNLGSELVFEFDMTDPLTLTNKSVSASLSVEGLGDRVGAVEGNRVGFTMLARNSTYLLRVALCNRAGCGSPCVLHGITQMYPPDPPDQVNVSDVTSTTAHVTWSYPPRENPSFTAFNAVLTLQGTTVLDNLTNSSLPLEGLLPGMTYTLSLRTLDISVGVVSSAPINVSFSTLSMAATEPRGLSALYNQSSLTVVFTQPLIYSGTPLSYELLWFPMDESDNCSQDRNSRVIPFNATLSSSGLVFVQMNDNIVQNQSLTVCVRLCTNTSDGGVINGMWAKVGVEKISLEGLGAVPVGNADDITGIVIAVLVLAILEVVLLSVLFAAIFFKKKLWKCSEK